MSRVKHCVGIIETDLTVKLNSVSKDNVATFKCDTLY